MNKNVFFSSGINDEFESNQSHQLFVSNRIKGNVKYSLLIKCSFTLVNQNIDFLAARAEITNQPKSKEITFHRGGFIYHRFLYTA
jgi:hypothetical protein